MATSKSTKYERNKREDHSDYNFLSNIFQYFAVYILHIETLVKEGCWRLYICFSLIFKCNAHFNKLKFV